MGKGELSKSHNNNKSNSRDFRKGAGAKKVVKKNISKKDSDRLNRIKRAKKLDQVKERKVQREKELQLKKAEKMHAKGKLHGKKNGGDDDEWEDVVDEHEKDVFDKDGYFDVPEEQAQISKNDEKLLQVLN